MAMTVMNNSAAALTLGELNKNITKLGKALTKVASGQKYNSAGDAASEYAISEKMRAHIRALEQDIQNVQNGSSMLKTASGGIDNIVDELRTLRELSLNAANDTNTDKDRATIQKEFNQRKANIDEIATETNYNGKPLLDGRWRRPEKNSAEETVTTDAPAAAGRTTSTTSTSQTKTLVSSNTVSDSVSETPTTTTTVPVTTTTTAAPVTTTSTSTSSTTSNTPPCYDRHDDNRACDDNDEHHARHDLR